MPYEVLKCFGILLTHTLMPITQNFRDHWARLGWGSFCQDVWQVPCQKLLRSHDAELALLRQYGGGSGDEPRIEDPAGCLVLAAIVQTQLPDATGARV